MAVQQKNLLNVDDIDKTGDVILVLTSEEALSRRQEQENAVADQKALRLQAAELTGHFDLTLDSPEPPSILVPTGDIRVRASSQVLIRKSPVFKIFLTGRQSLHAHELATKNQVEIFDDEADPEAFCHILNFLYDRWEEIPGFDGPGRLSFDTWLEALVIIDKYDFHRATRLLKSRWWGFFECKVPKSIDEYMRKVYNGETNVLPNWISATHIMGKTRELDKLLELYKNCATGRLDQSLLLPLPDRVQLAEVQRTEAFNAVNKLLVRYHRSMYQLDTSAVCACSDLQVARECDRATLRHIEKGLARSGFLSGQASSAKKRKSIDQIIESPPQIDINKVNFYGLAKRLRDMRFSHYCLEVAQTRATQARNRQIKAQNELRQRQEDQLDPYMGSAHSLDVSDWTTNDFFQPEPYPPYQKKCPKFSHAEGTPFRPNCPVPLSGFGLNITYTPRQNIAIDVFGNPYVPPQNLMTAAAPPVRSTNPWNVTGPCSHGALASQGHYPQQGQQPSGSFDFGVWADPTVPLPASSAQDTQGSFTMPIEIDTSLFELPKADDLVEPAPITPCNPSPAQNLRMILNSIESRLNENVPVYTHTDTDTIILDD